MQKIKWTHKTILLLCFLVPLGTMIGVMIGLGVQPFGENSFVIIDGLHQYMPFFSVLYDKLKSGGSLFYTFRAGLGMNFLALFAYYLSSPLNLLILFFKKTQLNMAVSLLIVLKIALSGLFAGVYFQTKTRKPDLIVVVASSAFALNSYMVGYCWNVMWLDAIMVLPLVALGIERLTGQGKGGLYTLALFYALYCNYYIGFMVCFFSVLWFLIGHFKGVKHFLKSGVLFALHSLLAGGMAAVVLIPAFLGIRQTASGETFTLPVHEFTTTLADIFNRQMNLAVPISHDNFDGNINLYMGTFTLLAAVLFLLNRQIALSRKLKCAAVIAFFYLSFCETRLNFIWHGFHDQYGIPNRFSFLLGFVFLCLLVEEFTHLDGLRIGHILIGAAVFLGLLWYGYDRGTAALEDQIYMIDAVLMGVYAAFLLFYLLSKRRKCIYKAAFCLAATAELVTCAFLGFQEIGQINVPKFFSGTEAMEDAVRDLDDGTFYRSDLANAKMVDEATWYKLNAVGIFGSTAAASMVDMMDWLGFYTGANEYLYKGATPVTNLFMGVRYLYYHDDDILATDYNYAGTYGDFDVYGNPNEAISVGYAASTDLEFWDYQNDYPFDVQNSFVDMAFDVQDIFWTEPIDDPVTDQCTATRTNEGEYYFEYEGESAQHMIFTIPVTEDAEEYFIHYDGTQVENAEIAVDGTIARSGDIDGYIIPIGSVSEGQTITVTFELKGEDETGYVRLSAAEMDMEAYRTFTRKAQAGAFRIDTFTDRSLSGTVTAQEDEELLFSIPYDEGWSVFVDGKKVKAWKEADAFLAVDLDEGTHDVLLTYTSPGFQYGLLISGACLIGFLLSLFLEQRQSRRRLRSDAESAPAGEAGAGTMREEAPDAGTGQNRTEDVRTESDPIGEAGADAMREEIPGAKAEPDPAENSPKSEN